MPGASLCTTSRPHAAMRQDTIRVPPRRARRASDAAAVTDERGAAAQPVPTPRRAVNAIPRVPADDSGNGSTLDEGTSHESTSEAAASGSGEATSGGASRLRGFAQRSIRLK